MAINDTVTAEATGVADGGDLIVDGSIAGIGAAQIIEMGGTGAATLFDNANVLNILIGYGDFHQVSRNISTNKVINVTYYLYVSSVLVC